MPYFTVKVPVAGYIEAYVFADSKDAALEKALDMDGEDPNADLYWGSMRHVCQGNVFYGPLAHYSIELEIEDED